MVRDAQLAASPYIAVFNSPEIGIVDYSVEVPAVPPVITKELEKRVLAKMALNQKTKRHANRDYLLSGMIRCAHCGMYLKGQTDKGNRQYYTHNNFYADRKPCPYNGVRLDMLEPHVMDYLAEFFFNKPVFDEAVNNALPTSADRDAIIKDLEANKNSLKKVSSKISNFTNAIGKGKELPSLIDALESAEAEKHMLEKRGVELQETLDAMPHPDIIKSQSRFIRGKMMVEYLTKDWRHTPFEDLRRFLNFLFSDNPRQNGYGILLGKNADKWHINFEGCFDFYHIINDGQAEMNPDLSEAKLFKLTDRMKTQDAFITAFRKSEELRKEVNSLQSLIDEAERLENIIGQAKNDENELTIALKGNPLFNGKDYL